MTENQPKIYPKAGKYVTYFFSALIGVVIIAALADPTPPTTTKNNSTPTPTNSNNSEITDQSVRGASQMMIMFHGYKCQNLKSLRRNTFSLGFTAKCDEYYQYQLKDVGGNWRVTVD